MPKTYLRRFAISLLRAAIRIAPHDTLDWGNAMLSELSAMEGDWAALRWAVGGARVLTKQALLSIVIPGSHPRTVSGPGALFAKENPMRKATLSVIAACAAASFLFLLAPAFRQGFAVSQMQWHAMVTHSWRRPISPALKTLAQQAEKTHDADALAFVAMRTSNSESARLADEAVQLDPKLVWLYALVAPKPSEADDRISKLEQWDPQNALPHFIEAENIDIAQSLSGKVPRNTSDESPAWQLAMAAAFRSAKLDDYHDQLKALDRRVVARYDFGNPYEVLDGECDPCWPSYLAWDASRYAKSMLESGETLEAHGDPKGALKKYLAVARFGQMMTPDGDFLMDRVFSLVVNRPLKEDYQRLASLYQKQGENEQAELFALLAQKIAQSEADYRIMARQEAVGNAVTRWNASVVQASGLLLSISVALLLICVLAVIVRSRSLHLSSLRASRGTLALGLCGVIGLLLSSALLYVSYRPYAEILQQFIRTGNDRRIPELDEFLSYMQTPLGAHGFQNQATFVFYFWFGVSALCVIALLFVLVRHLAHHRRAAATT
ncbi:MAG TPA: hypothetical protein VGR94_07005 [Candidatus Acidoferrales bacterium]|nr:hypothetical protein [Candidatus Acidoferrales bacterium]